GGGVRGERERGEGEARGRGAHLAEPVRATQYREPPVDRSRGQAIAPPGLHDLLKAARRDIKRPAGAQGPLPHGHVSLYGPERVVLTHLIVEHHAVEQLAHRQTITLRAGVGTLIDLDLPLAQFPQRFIPVRLPGGLAVLLAVHGVYHRPRGQRLTCKPALAPEDAPSGVVGSSHS